MIPQPHKFLVDLQEVDTDEELRIILINTTCSIEMNAIFIGQVVNLSSNSFSFLFRLIQALLTDQDKVMKEQDLDLHTGTQLYWNQVIKPNMVARSLTEPLQKHSHLPLQSSLMSFLTSKNEPTFIAFFPFYKLSCEYQWEENFSWKEKCGNIFYL